MCLYPAQNHKCLKVLKHIMRPNELNKFKENTIMYLIYIWLLFQLYHYTCHIGGTRRSLVAIIYE